MWRGVERENEKVINGFVLPLVWICNLKAM